jgi:hypothetical protein
MVEAKAKEEMYKTFEEARGPNLNAFRKLMSYVTYKMTG